MMSLGRSCSRYTRARLDEKAPKLDLDLMLNLSEAGSTLVSGRMQI